jgi:hypothetical protein
MKKVGALGGGSLAEAEKGKGENGGGVQRAALNSTMRSV